MKSIVVVGGSGHPFLNIGTAFFTLGVLFALERALPHAQITFIPEHPGLYWKRANKSGRRNVLIDDIACDYIVISGPMLSWVAAVWRNSLQRLKANGTKVVLLSAGCLHYSEKEFAQSQVVIKETRPYLIMTRDSTTYEMYAEYAEHSYNGICFAFFCSDYFTEPVLINSDDIIMSFDKGHDYNVLEQYGPDVIRLLETDEWSPDDNLRKLKRKRRASRITTCDKYRIVRTHHEAHPPLFRKILKSHILGYTPFQKPNCYVADLPEGYLHLFRNAKLTVSERVHACVPAIAFGNYAWLINKTKRSRIFSRIGLEDISQRPVRADKEALDAEKSAIIQFLRTVL
jgi:Polysaccharide pyruvyl transferase